MRHATPPVCATLVIFLSLFVAAPGRAGAPVQEAKLLASDGAAQDEFGWQLAVDGNTTIIGAPGASVIGAAYVFTRSSMRWTQQAKLTPVDPEPDGLFGSSVALDGGTAVIGARGHDDNGADSGAAFVFVLSGGIWTEHAKLLPADGAAGDSFGGSVALDGDTAVVGARQHGQNGINSGAAYVFTRSAGSWAEQAKLVPEDGDPADFFGVSVALDGDTALIGAFWDEPSGFRSGSAYVFTRSGESWTQQAKLVASDGATFEQFGQRVALRDDTAIIAAPGHPVTELTPGSAYVFTRTVTLWTEDDNLTPADGVDGDGFGWSVATDGTTAVIGSVFNDTPLNTGSVYVFDNSNGSWTQQDKLLADDGAPGDGFGSSVALDANTVVSGAPADDDNGFQSGSAYVFLLPQGVPAIGGSGIALLLLAVLGTGTYFTRRTRSYRS